MVETLASAVETDVDLEASVFGPIQTGRFVLRMEEGSPIDGQELVRDAIVVSTEDNAGKDLSVVVRPLRHISEFSDAFVSIGELVQQGEDESVDVEETLRDVVRSGKEWNSWTTATDLNIFPDDFLSRYHVEPENGPIHVGCNDTGLLYFSISKAGESQEHACVECPEYCGEKEHDNVLIATVTGDEVPIPELETLAKERWGLAFCDLARLDSHGKLRTEVHSDVITTQLPHFEMDFRDPLRIVRRPVQLLAGESTVICVDQAGPGLLSQTMEELKERRVSKARYRSAGDVSLHIVDSLMRTNESVLETLERRVSDFERKVSSEKLCKRELTDDIPILKQSLVYFKGKIDEMSDFFEGIEEAAKANDKLFGEGDPSGAIRNLERKAERHSSRAKEALDRLDDVRENFDTLQGSRMDRTITKFTILVGLTAPPMLADFLVGKENHLAMGIAFGVSLLLVGYGAITKWR